MLVFSGGKLEYRKGQDIAIAAFRLFRNTPEGKGAVLVTAWHNPWPQTMEGIWAAGHVKGAPKVVRGRADLTPWLELNGVPREAHLDLGQLTQAESAVAIRECDVAIFPNRCEGATNMVLSETLALGLPCVFGDWTGQADLCRAGANWSCDGAKNPPSRIFRGTDGWMETNPADIVLHLQTAVTRGYWKQIVPPSWADVVPRFSELLTVSELALMP